MIIFFRLSRGILRLRWFLGFLKIVLAIALFLGSPQPAWSANAPSERVPLTLEILQQQVNSTTNIDGISMIDLQNFIIDLRPENGFFRDQFYHVLQTQLNRSGTPWGVNLSHSLIRGDFIGSNLGLRIPLLGETLLSVFTTEELEQLNRDPRFPKLKTIVNAETTPILPELTILRSRLKLEKTLFLGIVDLSKTFFLKGVDAQYATFNDRINCSESRFSQRANFMESDFKKGGEFTNSIFFTKALFNQAHFQGRVTFLHTEFEGANFQKTQFKEAANFEETNWTEQANFRDTIWSQKANFSGSHFKEAVNFQQSQFEDSVDFRNTRFNKTINLQETSLQEVMDFSNAVFSQTAKLNLADLMFDSNQAEIIGDPGIIGQLIDVPSLQENENLLRNLIRNFRQQERITDANYIEYLRASLRLKSLKRRLLGVNLNTASIPRMKQVGFTSEQAEAIASIRTQQPFRDLTEVLQINEVDLATYLKVYNRVIVNPLTQEQFHKRSSSWHLIQGWILPLEQGFVLAWQWLFLSFLIVLSGYGTQFGLVFGIGIIAIAYFGLLFWFVDRCRRRLPQPILPTRSETLAMLSSFSTLTTIGVFEILTHSKYPVLSLLSLSVFLIPIPGVLIGLLYWQGRYHKLMDISYLTEEASLRQFRLMIGKLPIMPRYPLFRERHLPLLWDRRWNWLNYYDFSLNNLFKLGFNDIRLRDEHLPGFITALVWYQWVLGFLYLILLFWTLSRTIPGLNLLIYLK